MFDYQQCFAFLRYSIAPDKQYAFDTKDLDWYGLYRFAKEQAILGVLFEGVKRLSEQNIKPPFELLMQWIATAEKIVGQNRLLYKRCTELEEILQKDGFESCMLKGQGNALMYPNPYSRTPGDIDIWVKPKADGRKKKVEVRQIIEFLGTKCDIKRQIIGYHHVKFPIWKDVEVEVHWRPSWRSSPIHNHRLQRWFMEHAGDTCEKGGLIVPTWEFNVVYQLQHMFLHILHEGLGLRQVMDYYFVLKAQNDVRCKKEEVRETLRYLGLWKFAGAMMYVMKEVFALDEKFMIAPVDEKHGRFLQNEILQSGNFGQYDKRNSVLHLQHGIMRNIYQLKRSWRFVQSYPTEVICYPLRLYHIIWRKCQLWRWE